MNVFVFLEQLEVVESLGAGLAVELEVPGVLAIVVGQRLHNRQPITSVRSSVADPDPNPDPYVLRPPRSAPISQRYGSGSFYHQAKIVRKTLIHTVL